MLYYNNKYILTHDNLESTILEYVIIELF